MVLTSRHAVGAGGSAVRPSRPARLRQVGVLCFQPDDKPRVKVAFRLPYKVRAGSRGCVLIFFGVARVFGASWPSREEGRGDHL
jgi:hypothetical protein